MWRTLGIAGAIAVAASGIAPHLRASVAQTSTADNDRALFMTYCASCHGSSGRGDGPVADRLKVMPEDLTQFARRNGGSFPAEQTRRLIDGRDARIRAHGTSEMPIWGDAFIKREGLSEQAAKARIEAIVRYLDAIQERLG